MKIKRLLSITIVLNMLLSLNAYSLFDSEKNIVASKIDHIISPGLVYSKSIEVCEEVRQEIHSFVYSPNDETIIAPAYGQYIYGFNSVGQLVSNYEGDGTVVGGINTDFFITSTGIPLSCLLDGSEIITSCDNRAAIGFTAEGDTVVGYPEIKAEFISGDLNIPVAHINKTPAIWGAYLLTDKFSKTTKTNIDSVEIVFRSYDKELTDIAIEEYENAPKSEDDTNNEDSLKSEDTDTLVNERIGEDNLFQNKKAADIDENYTDDNEIDENINSYIPEIAEFDLLSLHSFTDLPLKADSETDVVITDIRKNVTNGNIDDGTYVLCIPYEKYIDLDEKINIGDRFTLKVDCNEDFYGCESIFGAGSIIVENGEFVEHPDESIYKYRNPRTTAGITENGEIIFVTVDGRRPEESSGFTIKEMADYLISLGCVTAVNFDGGGSTTFYARNLGELDATLKNTPSQGTERRVADGLLFINTTEPTEEISYGALYPERFLTYFKNEGIEIFRDLKFADSNFHPVELQDDKTIILTADENFGEISNNIFKPNGNTGTAEISATIGDNSERIIVGYVDITDTVDRLLLESEYDFLTPFDDAMSLTISPHLNTIPVAFSPSNIEWKLEYKTENNLGETEWVETEETDAMILDSENGTLFITNKRDTEFKITASLGDYSEEITIFAESHPFSDMELHWASRTSYDMYKKNLITGEYSPYGDIVFTPSRNMTRAEFCAILARALHLEIDDTGTDIDITDDENSNEISQDDANSSELSTLVEDTILPETINNEIVTENTIQDYLYVETDSELTESIMGTEEIINDEDTATDEYDSVEAEEKEIVEFSDADVPEWAKKYIIPLYENGFLSELLSLNDEGKYTINANEFITRIDIIRVLGSILEGEISTEALEKYADFVPKLENDELYFSRIVESGIINGYEDGTVRQNGFLTRAEGATVFSRFLSLDNAE